MRIAFFGFFGSLDYFKIGGNESFCRRLAEGLLLKGHQVDFIVYGTPTSGYQICGPGLGLYYCEKLETALETLSKEYDHVLTIYIHPLDRFHYMRFRLHNQKRIYFHQIFFSWPESAIKRKSTFLDVRLYSLNGRLFCISPRIFRYVQSWSSKAVLILPPVSKSYFLAPEDKEDHNKIRITYIGRTEPAKGIEEIINLFTQYAGNPQVELEIHGFHHAHSKPSVKIHEWLSRQDKIRYFYTPFEGYSPAMEDNLRATLKNTDILALSYRKLSSTIDSPLLLLEGMASLCAVMAPGGENILDIYGHSRFILTKQKTMIDIIRWVLDFPECLGHERQRLFHLNTKLGFQQEQVTNRFLEAIA